MYVMSKRYTVAAVRERLADALDEAEKGIPVIIERRGEALSRSRWLWPALVASFVVAALFLGRDAPFIYFKF